MSVSIFKTLMDGFCDRKLDKAGNINILSIYHLHKNSYPSANLIFCLNYEIPNGKTQFGCSFKTQYQNKFNLKCEQRKGLNFSYYFSDSNKIIFNMIIKYSMHYIKIILENNFLLVCQEMTYALLLLRFTIIEQCHYQRLATKNL